ncbi:P-loop containing nucleoside triphosphate hydrolase protein [Entophlyctis helioformis]|nr:P-loop containing nucleoside triphosphate hydrolase protein [Entophlyctis helioformis]
MSLWVDKHRPTTLGQLTYHDQTTDLLRQLSSSNDFPHLLVYGPSGAGKKTRVAAVLRELFGSGAEKLKIEARQFVTPSNKKLEINVVSSNFHVELTPSDVGNYDRIVVQNIIKEVAQTQQIDASARKPFKVVVLNEADSLSRDAQAGLRRTMEKYIGNMRVIMCCNVASKIIAPIRSRCLLVRIAAPTNSEIGDALQRVAKLENIKLSEMLAARIAVESDGNLRKAILMLEAAKVQQYPFNDAQLLPKTDWELYIQQIARSILSEQTPKALIDIRGKLYTLLSNCIPPEVIIKTLAFEILKNVDGELKRDIVGHAADYEHRMRLGTKAIFHLEAFVAKTMSVYGNYLIEIGQM